MHGALRVLLRIFTGGHVPDRIELKRADVGAVALSEGTPLGPFEEVGHEPGHGKHRMGQTRSAGPCPLVHAASWLAQIHGRDRIAHTFHPRGLQEGSPISAVSRPGLSILFR